MRLMFSKKLAWITNSALALAFLVVPAIASHAIPSTINLNGYLLDNMNQPLTGTFDWRVQFFDMVSGGSQIGGDSTGSVMLTAEGVFNINLTPPPAILSMSDVWYELAIDTGMNGIDGSDVFGDRVKLHSVPYALVSGNAATATAALDAESLGGMGAASFATDAELASHTHNLQDLNGAVTDAQVPDNITITETDTLDDVTGRGNTTANAITVGAVTSTAQIAGGTLVIEGDASAGSAVGAETQDQLHTSGGLENALMDRWQSFTAGLSGTLTAVGFNTTFGSATNQTIQIYEGQGTGGSLLSTESGVTMTALAGLEKFNLSSPPQVTAGQQYTIRVSGNNNALNLDTTGGYAGGVYSENAGHDLEFATWVASEGTLFMVDDAGNRICLFGSIKLADAGIPAVTAEHLYNNGGDLYWEGTQLNGGGGGGGGYDTIVVGSDGSGANAYNFGAFNAIANGTIVSIQAFATGYSGTNDWAIDVRIGGTSALTGNLVYSNESVTSGSLKSNGDEDFTAGETISFHAVELVDGMASGKIWATIVVQYN